jgi:hypothetical protein
MAKYNPLATHRIKINNIKKLINTFFMKTKHIYISGPVTENKDAALDFFGAEESLINYYRIRAVVKIINPMSICTKEWSWRRRMFCCLWHLITRADIVWMIPDWQYSRGARIEFAVAVLFGKEIRYL